MRFSMRKIFHIGLALLFVAFLCAPLAAQTHTLHERLYVSTDTDCYVAGENIWLSVFCFDAESGVPSNGSAVAYLELQDQEGTLLTAKIALINGRGSGMMALPLTVPTGIFTLAAYTRYMYAESPETVFHKSVTIYNPLTGVRSTAVHHLEDAPEAAVAAQSVAFTKRANNLVRINVAAAAVPQRSAFTISLDTPQEEVLQASVSVFKTSALNHYQNPSVIDVLEALPRTGLAPITSLSEIDYPGEIISAQMVDQENNPVTGIENYGASISIAGRDIQYYMGAVDSLGRVQFFTNNLYGDGVLVSQVPSYDDRVLSLAIDSIFKHPSPVNVPVLVLDPAQEDALTQRSLHRQLTDVYQLDSLITEVRLSENPLFENTGVTYKLDEYTRFPVMRDVITEFVREARFRGSEGSHVLQVRVDDALGVPSFLNETTPALVLLDGIPITDHEKIYQYDPALVESITLYPNQYAFGPVYFCGLAFFKTYTGQHSALDLGRSIRIQDYQGVQNHRTMGVVPVDSRLPDLRHTLYWNPEVTLSNQSPVTLEGRTGDLAGSYTVVVEGLSVTGKPFLSTATFTVQ